MFPSFDTRRHKTSDKPPASCVANLRLSLKASSHLFLPKRIRSQLVTSKLNRVPPWIKALNIDKKLPNRCYDVVLLISMLLTGNIFVVCTLSGLFAVVTAEKKNINLLLSGSWSKTAAPQRPLQKFQEPHSEPSYLIPSCFLAPSMASRRLTSSHEAGASPHEGSQVFCKLCLSQQPSAATTRLQSCNCIFCTAVSGDQHIQDSHSSP